MNRLTPRGIAIAISLSALAGCVDAIGFLQLGGYFISFMSGNSTQLAVGLTKGAGSVAIIAGIIALFVAGTVLGTWVSHFAKNGRNAVSVLTLVSLLLIGAATSASMGWVFPAIICMTLAMGAENAVFQRDGDVVVGLTYMTGTLVKMGQRIALAVLGKNTLSWIPYLLLWLGLICGGVIGALLHSAFGLQSLWAAAAWAVIVTGFVKIIRVNVI